MKSSMERPDTANRVQCTLGRLSWEGNGMQIDYGSSGGFANLELAYRRRYQ